MPSVESKAIFYQRSGTNEAQLGEPLPRIQIELAIKLVRWEYSNVTMTGFECWGQALACPVQECILCIKRYWFRRGLKIDAGLRRRDFLAKQKDRKVFSNIWQPFKFAHCAAIVSLYNLLLPVESRMRKLPVCTKIH